MAAKVKRKRKTPPPPGAIWRILAHGADSNPIALHSLDYVERDARSKNTFVQLHARQARKTMTPVRAILDEVVISKILHLEQMTAREWWMQLGDAWVWIKIDEKDRVTVDIERGQYGEERGFTIGKVRP